MWVRYPLNQLNKINERKVNEMNRYELEQVLQKYQPKSTKNYLMRADLALTLVFVVLKITGVISWSWWWVMSPVLFTAGLVVFLIVAFLLFFAIVAALGR